MAGTVRGDGDGAFDGTCHGLAVRSDVPLVYARDLGRRAGVPVAICEEAVQHAPATPPLISWEPRPGNALRARVHRSDAGYQVWVDGVGAYGVDVEGGCLTVPADVQGVRREEHLWAMPAVLLFSAHGYLPLHAAAVEILGGALVLAAPGRFGKTTLAAAFAQAGFRLLAEDLVCIDVTGGPAVLPGPAMLRIRSDVASRIGEVPDAREVFRTPDRVHLALEAAARGSGDPVPLRAVVMLSYNNELGHDRAVLEPMRAADALPNLWTVSFNLPTDEDRTRCFSAATRLAVSADLWNMTRRLRFASLPSMVEQLTEHFA